jgi:hypothetical protein
MYRGHNPPVPKNQLKATIQNAKTADLGAQMNIHGNSEDGLPVVLLPVTHTPVVQLESPVKSEY